MQHKLQFMLPDIKAAHLRWKQMMLACIENKNIHFLASPETPLGDLQAASVIERSNFIHEGERGVIAGAGLGLLAGLFALAFPPWYTHSSWALILSITTIVGILTGAIGMALLGECLANTDLKRLQKRIAQGEVLMIVKVPAAKVKEIRQMMAK
jgi:hypothetical protein